MNITKPASPALFIIYETTDDNLDGSPWPPDGDGAWAVVKRDRDRAVTTWRRIALTQAQTCHDH
jgi:hypothetical protein